MPRLFPNRGGRRRKVGICKPANGDANMIRSQINMPVNGAATLRTEMEADLAALLCIAAIDFARTFDSDVGFS